MTLTWTLTQTGDDGEVTRTEYKGFRHLDRPDLMDPQYSVVIAWEEGEPSLWLVDGKPGMESLISYYRDYGYTGFPMNVLHQGRVTAPVEIPLAVLEVSP